MIYGRQDWIPCTHRTVIQVTECVHQMYSESRAVVWRCADCGKRVELTETPNRSSFQIVTKIEETQP